VDDRLYRSTTDRSLAGVCGGIAAWLGLDPSLVRIVWVLLTLMSGGIFLIIYIVIAVIVPDAPPGWTPRGRAPSTGQGAPGAVWGPGSSWQGGAWQGGASSPNAPGGAWTGAAGWAGGTPPDAAGPVGQGPTAVPPGGTPPPGAPSSWPEDWAGAPGSWSGRYHPERAGIVLGVLLIVLGGWFLVGEYIPINWDLVWPIAVIALGAVLIVGAARRSR
jgi:phage shock protein C